MDPNTTHNHKDSQTSPVSEDRTIPDSMKNTNSRQSEEVTPKHRGYSTARPIFPSGSSLRSRKHSTGMQYQHTNSRQTSIATQNRGEGFSYDSVRYQGHPRDIPRSRVVSRDLPKSTRNPSINSHSSSRSSFNGSVLPPTHIGVPRCYDACVGDDFDIPLNPETLYDNIGSFNTYSGRRIPRTNSFVPQESIKDSGAIHRFYGAIADGLANKGRLSDQACPKLDTGSVSHNLSADDSGRLGGHERLSKRPKYSSNESSPASYRKDTSRDEAKTYEQTNHSYDGKQKLREQYNTTVQNNEGLFKDLKNGKCTVKIRRRFSHADGDDKTDLEGLFLVSKGDIANIVRKTLGEARKALDIPKHPVEKEFNESYQIDPERPQVDKKSNGIAIPGAGPAHPATTINSASISFTPCTNVDSVSPGHKKVVEYDGSNHATIVSLPSTAEYTWRSPRKSPQIFNNTKTMPEKATRPDTETSKNLGESYSSLNGGEKLYLSSFSMNH